MDKEHKGSHGNANAETGFLGGQVEEQNTTREGPGLSPGLTTLYF